IQLAEDAGRALRSGTWRLAQKVLFPNGNEERSQIENLVQSLAADRAYWAGLDVPFRKLMVDLADAWAHREEGGTIGEWALAIRRSAFDAFESAARSVETSGRGLRAGAEARAGFDQ